MMIDFAGRLKRLRIEKRVLSSDAGEKNHRCRPKAGRSIHRQIRERAHLSQFADRRLHGGLLRGFNRLSCLWRESRGRFG